jgi:hypothetical protein
MSGEPAFAPDATMVLGIASTAMPFARTPEAEAERWLRILRLHGEVGAALQALGVSDEPIADTGEEPHASGEHATAGGGEGGRDAVTQVADGAADCARQRGTSTVTTTDVLMAVMRVYGEDFDRVLQTHGAEREELLGLIGAARAVK